MKRIYAYLTVFLVFLALPAHKLQAQKDLRFFQEANNRIRTEALLKGGGGLISYPDVKGEVYIFKDFEEGLAKLTDNKRYKGQYRYDMFKELFEFFQDEKVYELAATHLVEIELGGLFFEYAAYKGRNGEELKTYFQVLNKDANIKLYKRNQVNYQQGKAPDAYQKETPPTFEPLPYPFYIKAGDQAAIWISSKRELIRIAEEINSEAGTFIKKNKISPKKEEKLLLLVEFLNKS